jgi:hypothetical protein
MTVGFEDTTRRQFTQKYKRERERGGREGGRARENISSTKKKKKLKQ